MSENNKNMMVYHSNNLDYLSQLLAHIMKVNPLDDPFSSEQVIVQSKGMKDWVNGMLARHLGISMQVTYSFPWAFVWSLLAKLGYQEESNPQQRFKMENMVWTIYSILPGLIQNDDHTINECFKSIYNYVVEPECNSEDYSGECRIDHVKLFQLSQSIAKVFDGYMLYRTKWLQHHGADQKYSYYDLYDKNFNLYSDSNSKVSDQTVTESQVLDLLWQGMTPEVWKKLPEKLRFLSRNNMWQVVLWEKILEVNKSERHIANMIDSLIADIDKDKQKQDLLPKRIFVFGISSLPPKFLELLKKLGSYIDVYYLLLNPCQEYWGDFTKQQADSKLSSFSEKLIRKVKTFPNFDDIQCERNIFNDDLSAQCFDEENGELKSGNSLLVSWGKQGRENLCQLLDAETSDIEIFEDPWNEKDPTTHTVLNAIKSDIFNMAEIDPYEQLFSPVKVSRRKYIYDQKDESGNYVMKHNIEIHSSFTRLREVECVYDAILDRIAKDPTLKPNDFIVMVPNINQYVPFIRAVFEPLLSEHVSDERKKRAIPYIISDQTYESESPFLKSVADLLNIYKLHIDQNLVLDFLNITQIKQKYGLTDEDWEKISNWIEKVHIRAEYDEDGLKEPEQDEIIPVYNTWYRAFRRMIVGTMMVSEQVFDENIQPYTDIEGSDIEVLGKLKSFVDDLEELRISLTQIEYSKESGLTASQWKNFITENVLEKFCSNDYSIDKERNTLEIFLDELVSKFDNINPEYRIRVSVFQNYLQSEISSNRKFKSFMSGKVNFCTFLPMRSIPFRHIFLLGMNDGEFPKFDQELGFDLMMNGFQRRGDRSEREDGRYMFLETLISATDSLYISYIGKSIQDKSVRNPSCVVVELENYLTRTFVTSKVHDEIKKVLDELKSVVSTDKEKKSELLQRLFKCYKDNSSDLMKKLVIEDPISSRDLANFLKLEKSSTNSDNNTAITNKRSEHDFYVQSYQDEWFPKKSIIQNDSAKNDLPILDERQGRDINGSNVPHLTISIENLINFLNDPTAEIYRRRFNVKIDEWVSDPSPSFEPFTVNDRDVNFEQANYYREFSAIIHNCFTFNKLSDIFEKFKDEDKNQKRVEMILNEMKKNEDFSAWINQYKNKIFLSGTVPVGHLGEIKSDEVTKKFAYYLDDIYNSYNFERESELINLTFNFKSNELPPPYCTSFPDGYTVRLTGIISNLLRRRDSNEQKKYYYCSNHIKNSEKFLNSVYVELLCLYQSGFNDLFDRNLFNCQIFDYHSLNKDNGFKPKQYEIDQDAKLIAEGLLAKLIYMYLSGMHHYMPTVIFDFFDSDNKNKKYTNSSKENIYTELSKLIQNGINEEDDNPSDSRSKTKKSSVCFNKLFDIEYPSSKDGTYQKSLNDSDKNKRPTWHDYRFIYKNCHLINLIMEKDPNFRTFENLEEMDSCEDSDFVKQLLEIFNDYTADEHIDNKSVHEYSDLIKFDLEQLLGYVFNCKMFPDLLLREIKEDCKQKGGK